MATALIDGIIHWRKKLDKNPDEDYILNVIRKLAKVPITLEILQATHIGKTIRTLSKRDDIVGGKAKAVLSRWRGVFANPDSEKNTKVTNISKKENVSKECKSSSKHVVPREKIDGHQKGASRDHEHKHKNSIPRNSSQESSKKHTNGMSVDCSAESKYSPYGCEKKEMNANHIDYDPQSGESYNPEGPELLPTENKTLNTKKHFPIEDYEPSLKRKLKEVDNETPVDKSLTKKSKTDKYSTFNSDSKEKLDVKSKEKDKLNLVKKSKDSHSTNARDTSGDKFKLENANVKPKTHSDIKKTKSKDCKNASDKSNKSKVKIHSSEEFTSSNVTFEDCLGFNDIVTVTKKKPSKPQTSVKQLSTDTIKKSKSTQKIGKSTVKEVKAPKEHKVSKSSHASKEKLFSVPKQSMKLDVADITSTLPEILPNYKPLPRRPDFYSPKKKEVLTNEDAIKFTSSRREKTAVYSGRKSHGYFQEIPTLFEICTRVLIENVDAIEFMGGMPYFLIKPVLERCTPSQLFSIESYNNYLLEDTNELWKIHCKRDYRLLSPLEHETWRELYLRAQDERERKLKSITANISASMCKSNPVRQVKLAYVDSIAKPPRDVARKQAKHGTGLPVNHVVKPGPPSKATPRPTAPMTNSTASSNAVSSPNYPPAKKPKIAPLMAKTLKSMKMCFRR